MIKTHKWTIFGGPLLGLSLIVFIIPLPAFMIDALVVSQWLLSVTLLLFVINNNQLSMISHLPSWLITITLARLGVNIITTRSILLQAKAGGVIEQAGELMMGERWSVGLVFFFGLLCVQYLVIAKGLERIAQLTARFNLEALPGAQQAIVSQQAQGQLHSEKARRLRNLIEERSLRSSAMEGVLKFIKGEQLASLCLILINLFGGAWIGHYHEQLNIHQALTLYGKLAIGDGLLAQLPALYCSLATTLYITRLLNPHPNPTSNYKNSDLYRVLFSSGLALFLIGILPIWTSESRWVIFSELALIGLFLLYVKRYPNRTQRPLNSSFNSPVESPYQTQFQLILSDQHIKSVDGGIKKIEQTIEKKRSILGLPQRKLDIFVHSNSLDQYRIDLLIDGEIIAFEDVPPKHVLTLYTEELLPTTLHPLKGVLGIWRPTAEHPTLLSELDFEAWLSEWLIYHWCSQVSFSWSAEEAWLWLNQGSPTLLEEALIKDQSPLQLTDLLRALSAERCSLKKVDHVLEGLIRARSHQQADHNMYVQELRKALGIKSLLGGELNHEIAVLWIEPQLDFKVSSFEIEATLTRILEEVLDRSESWAYDDRLTVVMVPKQFRFICQRLCKQIMPGLRVLSPEEVPTRVNLKVLNVFN